MRRRRSGVVIWIVRVWYRYRFFVFGLYNREGIGKGDSFLSEKWRDRVVFRGVLVFFVYSVVDFVDGERGVIMGSVSFLLVFL